jgi:AbrB family looped-hinge helix DNA binding protein
VEFCGETSAFSVLGPYTSEYRRCPAGCRGAVRRALTLFLDDLPRFRRWAAGVLAADTAATSNAIESTRHQRGATMNTVVITSRFDIRIPKQAREALGLKPGQSLRVAEYSGRLELVPVRPAIECPGLFGGAPDPLDLAPAGARRSGQG